MTPTNILIALSLVLATSLASHAQVGIGTSSPNAALDVTSTTNGFLPPRMTFAQRNAITTPAQGLMVYCNNCGTNGEAQLYNGTAWVNLVGGTATFGCGVGENVTHLGLTYGTVIGANSKCWLDRNLGATQVAASSTHTASYGDLYQWGRGTDGHQIRTSGTTSTLSTTDQPGHGNFITISSGNWDWRNPQNANLWQGVNGINNPCPSGYRLPTDPEWVAEHTNWSSQNSTGAFASPLKLPLAGYRNLGGGYVGDVGTSGYYWSSTVSGTGSRSLGFSSSVANMDFNYRANGLSVRCLKE